MILHESADVSSRSGKSRVTRSQKEVLKTWIAAGLWIILIAIESDQLSFDGKYQPVPVSDSAFPVQDGSSPFSHLASPHP